MSDNQPNAVQSEATDRNGNGGGFNEADYIISVLEKNNRLKEENALMKKYLVSARNNASLKTASVLTSILTWADESLCWKFEELFSKGGFGNVEVCTCTCSRREQPPKSATLNTFRPISPAAKEQAPNLTSTKRFSPSFDQGQQKRPQSTPVTRYEDTSSSKSTAYEKPSQSYGTSRSHQVAWSPNPQSNQPENWDSLMYRPSNTTPNYQEIYKEDKSSLDGRKSAGSEGYGSNMESVHNDSIQSDGRSRLGNPVMTSTPKKGQGANMSVQQDNTFADNTFAERSSSPRPNVTEKSKTEFSILNRPVDPVIGITAIYSDQHRQKLSTIQPNKRIIGEIAFQLDRRILEHVFTLKLQNESSSQNKRRRFYGFSLSNIGKLIRKEATDNYGEFSPRKELEMRYKFDYILHNLSKFGYVLEKHSQLSQDLVNKYGLLSGPPEKKLADELGLNDPIILRLLMSQIIKDDKLLEETLILLDCLCFLAYEDQKSLFFY